MFPNSTKSKISIHQWRRLSPKSSHRMSGLLTCHRILDSRAVSIECFSHKTFGIVDNEGIENFGS